MVEVWPEPRPCGLRAPRNGRGGTGILAHFDPRVAQCAEALKRSHPGWGADRVRIELAKDPALHELPLPKRSRLAAFFQGTLPRVCDRLQTPSTRPARRAESQRGA